jgi:MinD superfamily P-loop ATPase
MPGTGRHGFLGVLSQLFKEESTLIRPPYAVIDTTFEACKTCEAMCVGVCEEKIIQIDPTGLPFLDFSVNGCSNCHKCLKRTPNVLNDPHQHTSYVELYVSSRYDMLFVQRAVYG